MKEEKIDYKTRSEMFGFIIIVLIIGLLFAWSQRSSAERKAEDFESQVEELEYECGKQFDAGYEAGREAGYEEGLLDGRRGK